jgi:nickel superoxide dismutase
MYKLFAALDRRFGFPEAKAHCDIPCGIYDPLPAQIAAQSVVRMIDLMKELDTAGSSDKLVYHNSMSRYIKVKEDHAELVKHEIRVIWGDYIKAPHIEQNPELPGLVHEIMQLGSKTRQTADRDVAVQLVEKVNRFSEIFWKTKGKATKRVTAPYAPGLDMVYPDL